MIRLPAHKKGRKVAFLAGGVALCAIAMLTFNVAREIHLLGSARSDNVQWSLVQTQVDFLEYVQQVEADPVVLSQLRQEFDVFYSRVGIVRRASVFEALRADPDARAHLDALTAFVNDTVPIIDAPDEDLLRSLPELSQRAQAIDATVRALSNSGLDLFARDSDQGRQAVARTMTQLAVAIAALISVLLLAILSLNRLNQRIYRRERDHKQTSTRMSTVMATSLDGVIICEASGAILQFSPAAERIFGLHEQDVLGRDMWSVILRDQQISAQNPGIDSGMQRIRDKDGLPVIGKGRVKLEGRHASGRIFPVELAIQSATTDQGEIFIAFLRDISQRIAAEAELVAARDKALAGEKLKTDFLSTMSHEIRTPLNGLLGNLNLLRDTALTPHQNRYVKYMETSGRLLMNHISDVLDITRYDAGKLNTRSEPVDIASLLQDIIDNQNSTAARNETSLTWHWRGIPVDWIMSDHDRLQHVMMNLIGNAVKFTRRGRVTVTLENIADAPDTLLLFQIADTGPGMTDNLKKRVFDDFVTGNTAYDRDVDGTGLGLSIAKRFVQALGGEIGVDSEFGKGSTFWVKLPVTPAKAPMPEKTKDPRARSTRPLHVLLVEDNEINRIVAREMLLAEGHTVVEANDGKQGVDAARAARFDLILMDISMPVMDGRSATRAIRSQPGPSQQTTIIALTANAMAEEQDSFLTDGMNGILTKPLSRDALRDLLHQTGDTPNPQGPAMIDTSHSAEARDALGEETFVKLRSRFVTEGDELRDWLASDQAQDFLDIAARAHKTAGSAAVFGAIVLRDCLKSIEAAAKSGNGALIDQHTTEFATIWAKTKAQLTG